MRTSPAKVRVNSSIGRMKALAQMDLSARILFAKEALLDGCFLRLLPGCYL